VSRSADVVAAFQRVCETQLQTVYAYVRYRVSNPDAAEELTAKTFLRALERLETLDPAKGELTPLHPESSASSVVPRFMD
jgi:DNA-directed RNA polymerase specialized sigma24 family protein